MGFVISTVGCGVFFIPPAVSKDRGTRAYECAVFLFGLGSLQKLFSQIVGNCMGGDARSTRRSEVFVEPGARVA